MKVSVLQCIKQSKEFFEESVKAVGFLIDAETLHMTAISEIPVVLQEAIPDSSLTATSTDVPPEISLAPVLLDRKKRTGVKVRFTYNEVSIEKKKKNVTLMFPQRKHQRVRIFHP
jgi:hypothetical protein